MADVMMKVEASNIFSVTALAAALPSPANERSGCSAPTYRSHDPTYASHHDSTLRPDMSRSYYDFPRTEDVVTKEAQDNDTFSVRALAVALPSPENESSAPTDPWPVYDPIYVPHEPIPDTSPSYDGFLPSAQQEPSALYAPRLSYANTSPSYDDFVLSAQQEAAPYAPQVSYGKTSPCYYDFVPSARPKSEGRCHAPSFSPTTPNYAPPPPGRIDPAVATMFYGPLGEQNPREVWHGEMGIFGRIGLDCYNLQKGTNLQYLGLHDSMFTGVFAHHITAAAKDPIRNSNCKVETNVWFRKKKDCFTLHTNRCRMVPPAPADDYMGACDEGNHETELVMPDKWLPEDALTGSNKLQYYEMKESEVEQEKERLLLYAGFALFADYLQYTGKVLELGKVIVQTSEAVESKVKAKNAIFYVSFNIAGYDLVTFNGIVRRGTDGGPDRFTYEAKCFMDARQYR